LAKKERNNLIEKALKEVFQTPNDFIKPGGYLASKGLKT
jgi:hypothetical protein